jgi:predicted component of viral defense system (DUF524 family)
MDKVDLCNTCTMEQKIRFEIHEILVYRDRRTDRQTMHYYEDAILRQVALLG